MSEQAPPPNLTADRERKDRRTGRLLVGAGIGNLLQSVIIILLLFVITQVTGVNHALVTALTQQRDQFIACTDKPASTRGCTTPVAAEPSVIVKEAKPVSVPVPGVAGSNGLTPPCYFEARQCRGEDGKNAPTPAPGKDGTTPPCMQTPRQCQGEDGKDAPAVKDGKDGVTPPCMSTESQCQGKDGITPPCYFEPGQCQGGQGVMGATGATGVSVNSTECVSDDTADGSHWLITYSDGTQNTSPGPCRIKVP